MRYLGIGTIGMVLMVCSGIAAANEGMWLTENPPKELLREQYEFDCNDSWIRHLRRSSVRFNNGGSGSFCSNEGLVITNHHVGAGAVYKLSTPEHNWLADGFYAKTRDEELRCHDLELNVLYEVEDVTQRVQDAVAAAEEGNAADVRRAVIAVIEQEATERTGMRCDVVTLYRGGRYHLYCYKRYTDVRLVFAPEQQAAFFGGDPDNFEYPRFDLDITFFRVYENGEPAKIEDYLAWNSDGSNDGDLIFVSGHPGRTERLNTVDHLKYLRDIQMPATMASLYRREVLLKVYAARSPENARRAHAAILGVENSRKARGGMLDGLETPSFFAEKIAVEQRLKSVYFEKNKGDTTILDPWQRISRALYAWESYRKPYELFEGAAALQCRPFQIARTLVRLAEENEKPNEERLPEYRDSARESLEQSLFSEAPIYAELETLTLGDSVAMATEQLSQTWRDADGKTQDGLQLIYGGEPTMAPKAYAAVWVAGTKLMDVAYRKELAAGGRAAIEASDDPMIQLARRIDAVSRSLRKKYESEVDEPLKQAYAELAELQFETYGDALYPDATFTLRLAFGVVKGYEENGKSIPAYTKMGGMFERSEAMGGGEPFDLPPRWAKCRDQIHSETPFNFVSTADIIGGNSGSPVVDREGRFVGIIFDGNIQSLVLDYGYTEEQARATSVDVRAVIESLRNIYHAESILEELSL